VVPASVVDDHVVEEFGDDDEEVGAEGITLVQTTRVR
jgi:hypothetical protein